MPCTFKDVEGDVPWLVILPLWVLVLISLLSLQEEPEGRIGWSGFIGWDDEASLDEAFSDFVVECEGYQGC